VEDPGAPDQPAGPNWARLSSLGVDPNAVVVALIVGVAVFLLIGVLAAIFFPSATAFPFRSVGPPPRAIQLLNQARAAQRDREWVSGANMGSAAMLALATLVLALAAPARDHTRDFASRACASVAGLALVVAGGAVAAIVIDLTHRAGEPGYQLVLGISSPLPTVAVSLAVLFWVEAIAGHPGDIGDSRAEPEA
jgi:hypothetical protein